MQPLLFLAWITAAAAVSTGRASGSAGQVRLNAAVLRTGSSGAARGAGSRGVSSLRVCNAATAAGKGAAPLLVQVQGSNLTDHGISMGECRELPASLGAGDRVELRLGPKGLGQAVEVVGREMQDNPVLFLVAYCALHNGEAILGAKSFYGRHDGLASAQVAFIDASEGTAPGQLVVRGPTELGPLADGAVHHVEPGKYALDLKGSPGGQLVALHGECYIVVKVEGGSPIVYPASDPSMLGSTHAMNLGIASIAAAVAVSLA